MRILHTSDWHLGKTLHEHSLIEDQKHFLDQLLDLIQSDPHDALLIAGDIYDRSVPPAEAISLLSDFLGNLRKQSDIPVLIIPGNHDSAGRLNYLSSLVRSQNLYFLSDPERLAEPVRIQDVDFYGIPFLSPYDMEMPEEEGKRLERSHENAIRAALAEIRPAMQRGRKNVLMAHVFATGGKTSESERTFVGATGEVDVSIFSDFDYVALGHLHRPQSPAPNAHYSGSPLAYSFSESSDDKCILSVNLSDEPPESEPRAWQSDGPPFIRKISVDPLRKVTSVSGTYLELLESGNYDAYREDYLQIELEDNSYAGSPMKELSRRFPYLLSVRRKNPLVSAELQSLPSRKGKTIQDDFEAFQEYLYPDQNNSLLDAKKKLLLEEVRP